MVPIGAHSTGENTLGVLSFLIDTLKHARHTQGSLVLLHVFIVVVKPADGEIPRVLLFSGIWHHNTLATTASRCPDSDLLTLWYLQVLATSPHQLETASPLVDLNVLLQVIVVVVAS